MLVVGFACGPLAANCYLLATSAGGGCVIVDPGQDAVDPITAALRQHRLTPDGVLLTHGHFDHVDSASAFGVPVWLHEADRDLLPKPVDFTPLEAGTLVSAGLEITVDHTPGHTPGSVVLRLTSGEGGKLALTGDTLFAGSVGRGDAEELQNSLRAKVMILPGDTVVLPGHGPATTIGAERTANPYFGEVTR